jgi:hypothetical protein
VCVPTTTLARPSQKWPIAIFSEVASQCTSTRTACACPPGGWRLQHRLDGRERVVEGPFHEDLPEHLRHQHLAPARRVVEPVSATRRTLGKVDRPDDARLCLDEGQHLLLVEGMIAERHHIRAGLEQQLGMRRREPGAGGRVLAVHDAEIHTPCRAKALQPVPHGLAAAAADHVSEKEQSHTVRPRARPVPGQAGIAWLDIGQRGRGADR